MNRQMIAAHLLAHELEAMRARDVANSERRGRSGRTWLHEYDAHAATELGNLIYARVCVNAQGSASSGAGQVDA